MQVVLYLHFFCAKLQRASILKDNTLKYLDDEQTKAQKLFEFIQYLLRYFCFTWRGIAVVSNNMEDSPSK